MRILLGAFGDPGHAFPMLALGSALVRRGHDVAFQTWAKWTADTEAAGMTFLAAPEYQVFPTAERPMRPYEAAIRAAEDTVEPVRSFAPDACVSDIITLAPALAAEVCGVPVATLIPHVTPYPGAPPGGGRADLYPPFAMGALPPRTAVGRGLWRAWQPVLGKGLDRGAEDYNFARGALGLAPREGVHPGLSRALTLVATLPQLEYPRDWPAWMQVTGPLLWEPPGERVDPPPGDPSWPVVLVAPSTAHDAEHRLLRAALDGLADEPVRVIATWNGRRPPWLDDYAVPANAVLVPWLSYAQTMPACDLAILHGGHGTLARALVSGCAVLVAPAAGDQFENAARATWSGAGVRLPRRYVAPRTVRLAVRRALTGGRRRAAAQAIAATAPDGAAVAADAVEAWCDSPGRTRTSKP